MRDSMLYPGLSLNQIYLGIEEFRGTCIGKVDEDFGAHTKININMINRNLLGQR